MNKDELERLTLEEFDGDPEALLPPPPLRGDSPMSASSREERGIEFRMVRCGDIRVDPSYHRPIDFDFVDELVAQACSGSMEGLLVSRREDGQLYLVDGRRVLQAVLVAQGEEGEIKVRIPRETLSLAEEAKLFIGVNCCRRSLSVPDMLKAGQAQVRGGVKGAEASVHTRLNSARENLSPEDLKRAQQVAGLTVAEAQEIVGPWRTEEDPGPKGR